ncbi:MAG: N-acetylneuraminate synthase [Cyclobacteriaceae bacterium]
MKEISNQKRPYIIAEAGVNHNGSTELALKLVNQAKKVGADCIKFQTFKAERVVTVDAPKAEYQMKVTDENESQFDMLKSLELDYNAYKSIIAECSQNSIDFLSTPYSMEDALFLNDLGVGAFKIASGQLTELPLLASIARLNKQMIISTGMATIGEVFEAVQIIRSNGNNDIIVLQCTTNYPSDIEDANILSMNTIRDACGVRVGYSDHVENDYACLTAVALGAEVIEKHFTLDRSMSGPDHKCSADPSQFKQLCFGIDQVYKSLGSCIKKPSQAEIRNAFGMKRSIVAKYALDAGTVLTEDLLAFKRPSNGLPPSEILDLIGKKLAKSVEKDEPITLSKIDWED